MTQEPRHFVAALAVPPNMRFRAYGVFSVRPGRHKEVPRDSVGELHAGRRAGWEELGLGHSSRHARRGPLKPDSKAFLGEVLSHFAFLQGTGC